MIIALAGDLQSSDDKGSNCNGTEAHRGSSTYSPTSVARYISHAVVSSSSSNNPTSMTKANNQKSHHRQQASTRPATM